MLGRVHARLPNVAARAVPARLAAVDSAAWSAAGSLDLGPRARATPVPRAPPTLLEDPCTARQFCCRPGRAVSRVCPGRAGPGHKGPLANLLRAGLAVFRRSGFGQAARPGLPVMPAFTRQPNDIDGRSRWRPIRSPVRSPQRSRNSLPDTCRETCGPAEAAGHGSRRPKSASAFAESTRSASPGARPLLVM